MDSLSDISLNVTGSSAGSAPVIGQGATQVRTVSVIPQTFGLAAGTDGLMGSTVDEGIDTADMSGPSVGQTEEVATTSFTPATTRAQAAAISLSGKLRSLVIHVDLITASGNQIK